jgi:putative exosortase-associated protein (TIGR04073 family)
MKSLLTILLAVAFGAVAYADIQAPPMTDMGPTRKLGRGLSNMLFGFNELPATIVKVNKKEGNSAIGYGVTKGLGRSLFRFGIGWYEIITFAAPCYKSSYRPPYRSNIPWINGGFEEFPPELGWNSAYDYTGY